jgi:hypothetical protein
MHDHKTAGIPIGQGVTLVIAKKTAAGPGGYADFGTGPDFPDMPEPQPAGPAGSDELGEEIRTISERLCEIATEMGAPKGEMAGDEGPKDSEVDDSQDEPISEKKELS